MGKSGKKMNSKLAGRVGGLEFGKFAGRQRIVVAEGKPGGALVQQPDDPVGQVWMAHAQGSRGREK